jgi:hypothetical protein
MHRTFFAQRGFDFAGGVAYGRIGEQDAACRID